VKFEFTGASQLWIDGEHISEPSAAMERPLSAGVHTLAVLIHRKQVPPTLRVSAQSGVFVTP
jgi:hypothetical protein